MPEEVVQVAEEEGGAESGVPHNQIRLDVRPGLERLEHGMAVPDGIFKGPAAVVRLFGGTASDMVLNALNLTRPAARLLRHKRTAVDVVLGQIVGNMAELSGKILVDEKNVHISKRMKWRVFGGSAAVFGILFVFWTADASRRSSSSLRSVVVRRDNAVGWARAEQPK